VEHSALLSDLGFNQCVHAARNRGVLLPNPSMVGNHPAFPFLETLAKHGVPMVTSSVPWTEGECKQRLKRGPHKSCNKHLKFCEMKWPSLLNKATGPYCPTVC
jgi:hypothetical protein